MLEFYCRCLVNESFFDQISEKIGLFCCFISREITHGTVQIVTFSPCDCVLYAVYQGGIQKKGY